MRSAENMPAGRENARPGMKAQTQTFEIHHVAELSQVRCDLDSYFDECSLSADLKYDLLTCVQEASKNAVRFADTPCGVHVSVTVDAAEVLVTVRDHGVGLDLEQLTDLPPDPLSESGRGLFLLRVLMDEVEFLVDEGTEVRLRRRLQRDEAFARQAA
jgi:anti-sigma regulatory factor (Ser/Thr protein kinase)